MSGFTLVFQIVNFVVLMALLRRFLFKPVLAMVKKRQQEIERAAAESARLQKEAVELRASAEKALAAAADAQGRALAEARAQGERERAATLADTRREADALLEAGKRQLAAERDKTTDTVMKEAVDLGVRLSRRLLTQVAAGPILESFLARLCETLEQLPDERKRALRADLDGQDLVVATAPRLDEDAAKRWLAEIDTRLGTGARLRAIADESLLAGAELRFPHAAISACWRDGVEAAEKELVRT